MQSSRRHCLCASLALVVCIFAPRAPAETLTITSSPPDATVEIDGLVAGTTPYETDFPGGYFHKTHLAFSTRLEHSMIARISKDGYLSQQIMLTNGPFEWVAITGRRRGSYFLLRTNHFEVRLDPASQGSSRTSETTGDAGPMRPTRAFLQSEGSSESRDVHSASGRLTISSDPVGAEIYVEGSFIGQTPATIELSAGMHHIEIESRGRRDWARELVVLKDSQMTLRPALEPSP